jgi:CubicO group peptidase (beta-lactamase class C family)
VKKLNSLVLFILIITSIPISQGIDSPLMKSGSRNLIQKKVLQEEENKPFNTSIDETIGQFMLERHVPSLAACVVYKDSIIWSKGYGEQSKQNVAFMIGSITKTFVVTALLQLYEQGSFELDEDVNNYLPFPLRNPNWPNKPVTFRSLLLHQSSLLRGGETYYTHILNDLEQKIGYTNKSLPSFPIWLEDVILASEPENISELWGTWAPGEKQTQMKYSNLGYDILGYLIERIADQSIEEYIKSNIFDPLNMTKTHYSYQSYSLNELALPYEYLPDEIKEDMEYPWGAWPETDENKNYKLPIFNLDELGAGALRSTTTDLAHFLIAHMNNGLYEGNRILTEDSIHLIHDESQVTYGNNLLESYGFGWINNKINTVTVNGKSVTQPLQGHSGRIIGFNSLMFYNQDMKIGVILFANQGHNFVGEFPLWDIFEILYSEGLLFRDQDVSNIPEFYIILFSITILLSVIFIRKYIRNSEKKSEEKD